MLATALVALAGAVAVAAQATTNTTCSPQAASNFVVLNNVPAGSETINSGGLWGGVGVNVTYGTANGARVIPTGANLGENYYFFKFDTIECYDITPYAYVQFDWQGPAGSNFDMTFTVHDPVCLTVPGGCHVNSDLCPRLPDSTYLSVNRTTVPNGTMQTTRIPLTAFYSNTFGNGTTEFHYIKDWTFINFYPLGAEFYFNNFQLVPGGCVYNQINSTTTTAAATLSSATAAATAVGSTSATVTALTASPTRTSGAETTRATFLSAFFVALAALFV